MDLVVVNDNNIETLPDEALTATRLRVRLRDVCTSQSLEPLVSNTNLKSIKFKLDFYQDYVNMWMADLIGANPGLESATIDRIDGQIITALGKAVNLRKLRMTWGLIPFKAVKPLASLIASLPRLRCLELSNLGDEDDTIYLYGEIKDLQLPITELTVYVSLNSHVYHVCDMLRNFKNLRRLTIVNLYVPLYIIRRLVDKVERDYPYLAFTNRSVHRLKGSIPRNFSCCSVLMFALDFPSIETVEEDFSALSNIYKIIINHIDRSNSAAIIRFLELNPQIADITILTMHEGAYLPRFMAQLTNVTRFAVHLTVPRMSEFDRNVVLNGIRGHNCMEYLRLCPLLFLSYTGGILELVKTMPRLHHYTLEYSDQIDPDIMAAKDYCRTRKYNHKTYDRTLVHKLLKGMDM